jgi:hypothetical protein
VNYYINLSVSLLEKAKSGEDTILLRKELYYVTIGSLVNNLKTDELKFIFWENIYNAYLLIMLKERVLPKYIFKVKRIKISRYILSLNDIEYGILKKPKFKIGVYPIVPYLYPSHIKQLAVEKTDVTLDERLNKNILQKKIES